MFNTDVWTHPSPWQGYDYNIENYIKTENLSEGTFELNGVQTIHTGERQRYFASGQQNSKGTTVHLKISDEDT